MTEKDLPRVTIAMPCLNEEAYIERCIESVLEQDYPEDLLEVVVADGMSTDGTRRILERLAAAHAHLRVIENPDRIQAAAMNRIVRVARGDVIVRMDVHAEYAPDYVRKCVEVLEKTGADNVGGAARPKAKTPFQRALCAALSSPLGVGGAKHWSADAEGFVETVPFGAFRRRVFETVGLFDPKAVTNEDAEINGRIRDAGGKVFLSREIVSYYFPRDSYRALAKQYFKYGMGRARTALKQKRLASPRPAIPFLMVVGGVSLVALPPLRPLAPIAFGAYAVMTLAEAARVGRRVEVPAERLRAIPIVWGIFPVLHAAHGVGFAAGLVRYLREPDWAEPERVSPRTNARTKSLNGAPTPTG
jgi:glycosyltransferase involved in cell wall biosynthesis